MNQHKQHTRRFAASLAFACGLLGLAAASPAASATVTSPATVTAVYRLYAPADSDHLYTASAAEEQSVAKTGNYALEGVIGYAPAATASGAVPVYRLYHGATGEHFYTVSAAEKTALSGMGWAGEGVAFGAFVAPGPGLLPLYRLYSPASGHHFYTTSQAEHDSLVHRGWKDEGILGYLDASPPAPAAPPTAPPTASAPVMNMSGFAPPADLAVHSVWAGACPVDTLTWDAVPGAGSYNVYQYDTLIAKGVTGTSYAVPPSQFNGSMDYTVTAVCPACGTESIPSAPAGAGGMVDPGNVPSWVSSAAPPPPTAVAAAPEWNAGRPRVRVTWAGSGAAQVYDIYRDGVKVAAGLWGLAWFDSAVQPGETHAYAVSGVNTFWPATAESAPSAAASATAPAAAPPPLRQKVQIVKVLPNDDGATVFFSPVPGAADYRVYSTASPGTVKYAGSFGTGQSGDMVKNGIAPLPAPTVLSIEMNGLDPVAGASLVVEAVDKLGPFQKMDGVAGPGAMQMGGSMSTAINGQGDPSDVPIVVAASDPFPVTCQPRTLTGSQVFFDSFRGEKPLAPATPEPAVAAESNSYSEVKDVVNDKWRLRTFGADTQMTHAFFMGNHFMDTLYDGPTAATAPFSHDNNASLVMIPQATADISGGKVLHATFEVDAHFDSRRWCDLFVGEAGDPLLHASPQKLGGALPTVKGNLFVWEIMQGGYNLDLITPDPASPAQNKFTDLGQFNGFADQESAARDIYSQVFGVHPSYPNGSQQNLDKRSRFDLYLSQTHYRVVETGPDGVAVITREKDFPAGASLPFTDCQVYFTHELYHTGNDRPEQEGDPNSACWVNDRPYSDERHWDNMGFEVLPTFPK